MKYYSEIVDKFFESEEELLCEEQKYKEKQESLKVTKANLAKKIEVANTALEEAYKAMEEAKKKDKELYEKYKEESKNIIEPCREEISKCLNDRAEAIKEFNRKFGSYKTTYTGDKALEEFDRILNIFNSFFW